MRMEVKYGEKIIVIKELFFLLACQPLAGND